MEKQHEPTTYAEADLAPEITVVKTSLTAIVKKMGVTGLRAQLEKGEVFMLCDGLWGTEFYAMVTPISFDYLLEVAEVLRDDRDFTIAQPLLEGIG